MRQPIWLMALALNACGAQLASPAAATGPDAASPDAVEAPPEDVVRADTAPVDVVRGARMCLATGEPCRGGTLQCCAGYCDYNPYAYAQGSGRCVAPRGDGEYCESSRFCSSGRCVDELCRSRSCVAASERCHDDAACCAGFCTARADSYAPGRCVQPQPAGASCDDARWCMSGRCVDSVCV